MSNYSDDDYLRLLAKYNDAHKRLEAMQWRDIASAPKDGLLLVYFEAEKPWSEVWAAPYLHEQIAQKKREDSGLVKLPPLHLDTYLPDKYIALSALPLPTPGA